jgi:cobalt transporter subunit CbtA
MLRRILTTGLMAGLTAGLFLTLVQFIAVQPLIVEAEILEAGAAPAAAANEPANHAANHVGDHADGAPWAPEDGLERTGFTLLANVIAGVGFGFLLAGCFALYGGVVDVRRGLVWGLAGYTVFALAPALGLPPEAPGTVAADVFLRQSWWLGTVGATASGLALVIFARARAFKALGAAIMVLPHLIGAPHHAGGGGVPPDLASAFIIASLVATGLFWLALGGVSGAVYRRLA